MAFSFIQHIFSHRTSFVNLCYEAYDGAVQIADILTTEHRCGLQFSDCCQIWLDLKSTNESRFSSADSSEY